MGLLESALVSPRQVEPTEDRPPLAVDPRELPVDIGDAQVAELTHDVNNLLTAIYGHAQVALDSREPARVHPRRPRRHPARRATGRPADPPAAGAATAGAEEPDGSRPADGRRRDEPDALAADRRGRRAPDRVGLASDPGRGRPGRPRGHHPQPRDQRPRRHAVGRRPDAPDRGHLRGRRSARRADRGRHRHRHGPRHASARVRAVLHDEGPRPGQRAGARLGRGHGQAQRLVPAGRHGTGRGQPVHGDLPLAARRVVPG